MRGSQIFVLVAMAFSVAACSFFPTASQVFDQSTTSEEVALIPVTAPQVFEGCAGPKIETIHPEFEQAVVEQTNAIRAEHNLPPLKRVDGLDFSARYHTADMSVNNFFNHNTVHKINGQEVQVCDTWTRIAKYYTSWTALAENIAAGQRSPEMAMDGWMNSPDHRHNILSDAYWEIGVGYYEGEGDYHTYWGQNFGRREGVFPLIINGEKASTTSPTVEVYIYGDWTEMRLRDTQGTWTDWMPFQQRFAWQLLNTPGPHSLTAELRGPDGSAASTDTIELVDAGE